MDPDVELNRAAWEAASEKHVRRAEELAVACRYVVAEVPGVPLRSECADLVYTGKGALIWMRDLAAWARDAARLLGPGDTCLSTRPIRRYRCGPGTKIRSASGLTAITSGAGT
jgi:hypothetical protein